LRQMSSASTYIDQKQTILLLSSKINLSIIPGHGTTTAPQNYEFNDETAIVTNQYYYWLEVIDYGGGLIVYGSFIYYPNVSNDDEPVAQFVSLHNYPNPFTNRTEISYSLTRPENIKIQIYNLKGQLVETLLDENKTDWKSYFRVECRRDELRIYL